MKWSLKHAVISTLAYADIFDYPLKQEEIYRWLISNSSQYTRSEIAHEVSAYPSFAGYIGMANIQKKARLRILREAFSQKKWPIAIFVVRILSIIPSIHLIGVSGGLAMNNADEKDDIDLFFIVHPGTIWISRLFVLIVLQFMGKRRKVGDAHTINKICSNMFIDTKHLVIPTKEQDLYTAHEVLQMIPLYEIEGTYMKFLLENTWTKKYLPNAWAETNKADFGKNVLRSKNMHSILISVFCVLDFPSKYIQRWYMKNHMTTEIISDSVLRFHPRDVRISIRQQYPKLLKKYKVPLDSSFFHSLQ